MNSRLNRTALSLFAVVLISWPVAKTLAAAPSASDLKAVVSSGKFDKYSAKLAAWLNSKVPAEARDISETTLQTLLKEPDFTHALAQRQFIAKVGTDTLAGRVAGGPQAESYREFLAWVLQSTEAMENCLEGMTPVALEPIPNTRGLWQTTQKLELKLEKGMQTITLTRPADQRGLAMRYLELKAKK